MLFVFNLPYTDALVSPIILYPQWPDTKIKCQTVTLKTILDEGVPGPISALIEFLFSSLSENICSSIFLYIHTDENLNHNETT